MAMILKDLKNETFRELREIMMFDDSEIKAFAEQFFEGAGILSKDGFELSAEERFNAMKQIVKMGRSLNTVLNEYTPRLHKEETYCSAGVFRHIYCEKEEYEYDGCFDGGGGNFSVDYVDQDIIFTVVNDGASWEELEAATEDDRKFDSVIPRWRYNTDLEDESCPVIVGYWDLYLLDPFGMKGIFKFRR